MTDPATSRLRNLRAARLRRIVQFTEQQRTRREWINFAEIAEWYRNAVPSRTDQDARNALRAAVLSGDFETDGRCRLMYLHSRLSLLRMQRRLTRDMLQEIIPIVQSEEIIWADYLGCCWISNSDARSWFEQQNLTPPAVLSRVVPTAPSPTLGRNTTTGYLFIPTEEPRTKAVREAWRGLRQIFPDGSIRLMSMQQLTDMINKRLRTNHSRDAIERALGRRNQ